MFVYGLPVTPSKPQTPRLHKEEVIQSFELCESGIRLCLGFANAVHSEAVLRACMCALDFWGYSVELLESDCFESMIAWVMILNQ